MKSPGDIGKSGIGSLNMIWRLPSASIYLEVSTLVPCSVVLVMMGMHKGAVVRTLCVLPPRSQPQPQLPVHHTSGGAQPFDPTIPYADGPRPPSRYAVPHGHSANTSDSCNQLATEVLETAVAPEPLYQETYPQERVMVPHRLHHRDGYIYDDLNEDEFLPKGPSNFPAQGRCE